MKPREIRLAAFLGSGIFLLAPFVVPFFVPWSEINCRHQEINLQTGQFRQIRFLWYFEISSELAETPLSEALRGKTVGNDADPWRRVNSFTPYLNHSPHDIFHGALYQARQIPTLYGSFSTTAKKRFSSPTVMAGKVVGPSATPGMSALPSQTGQSARGVNRSGELTRS